MSKLLSELIAQSTSAHRRDGQTTCRHHQRATGVGDWGLVLADGFFIGLGRCADGKAGLVCLFMACAYRINLRIEPYLDPCRLAFIKQHGQDVLRRIITKQLPVLTLMIGDLVPLDHRDKLPARITAEC